MDNNFNGMPGGNMPNMNQSDNQTVQIPDMNQQYQAPDMSQQYQAPDMSQQYQAPDMSQQYQAPDMNQPYQAPNMNQQYQAPDMNQPYQTPNMNQQFGQPGVPPQPNAGGNNGGKKVKQPKVKKPLGKGAIAGIIGGGVALVALIVCGILFIPKLFKSDKEVVLDAFEETFAQSNETNMFDETFGDITEKSETEGFATDMTINIDQMKGVEDLKGLAYDLSYQYDKKNKELSIDADLTYDDSNVMKLQVYSDKDKTYFAIPDIIDGAFTINNAGGLDALASSYIGQQMDMSGMSGDINFFPDDDATQTEVNSNVVKAIEVVWDNAEFKKQGKAKVDVNGETMSTKEYYVTLGEADIEAAICDIVDYAGEVYSSQEGALEEAGLDAVSLQTSIDQIKQLVPTLVSGDFILKVYIKDGKIVKLTTDDQLNIMGVKLTYDCYVDISKDFGAEFNFGVANQSIGLSIDLDDYKTAPTGEIKVTIPDNEIVVGVKTVSADTDTAIDRKINFTLSKNGDSYGSADLTYKFDKSNTTFDIGVSASDADGKDLFDVACSAKYTDIVKGESCTCNIENISVSIDGKEILTASATANTNVKPAAKKIEASTEYDITTIDESKAESILEDNQDKVQAWLEKINDIGEQLGISGVPGVQDPISEDLDLEDEDLGDDSEEDTNDSILKTFDESVQVEILKSLDGLEKSYGCEYFIDYENDEHTVSVEYEIEADTTVDDILNNYSYYDSESVVEELKNQEITISDGTLVKYDKNTIKVYEDETMVQYYFAIPVNDTVVLVATVKVYDSALTVEQAAEVLNSSCFNIIQ